MLTANCPICHRAAPVTDTGHMAHHMTADRPCSGVGATQHYPDPLAVIREAVTRLHLDTHGPVMLLTLSADLKRSPSWLFRVLRRCGWAVPGLVITRLESGQASFALAVAAPEEA